MSPVSPRWDAPETVAGFVAGAPNATLLAWARERLASAGPRARLLDLGCGALRNALPLAADGWRVVALDLSAAMLDAARARIAAAPEGSGARDVALVRAPMEPLPFRDAAFDVVVAHGVWNLARTDAELLRAVAEAARVARPGAGLFLFTFDRTTVAPSAEPVAGQRHVFTQFGGEPQTFLTEREVLDVLAAAGWERDPPGPLTRLNARSPLAAAPPPGARLPPVVWQATFRRAGRP